MSAVYDKMGIRFEYPTNWALDERDAVEGNDAVSVHSPSGAFWSVVVHSPSQPLGELLDAAVSAMREEYDELDAEPMVVNLDDRVLEGFELNFFCLELTNTAVILAARLPQATLLIFYQADDREFAEAAPVFQAITRSLVA